jgi:hypothetical protein
MKGLENEEWEMRNAPRLNSPSEFNKVKIADFEALVYLRIEVLSYFLKRHVLNINVNKV